MSGPESTDVKPGSVTDPERERCFQAIQLAIGGTKLGAALAALADSLAAVVAFASANHAEAHHLIDELGRDMKKAAIANWQSIKDQAADSHGKPGHG